MNSGNSAGKIVTFYSYKGGTGRSMAVANVAWILATAGRRVLVIDWDLEAPGLHRYLHPFLEDKELSSSAGLIDLFLEFTAAARRAYAVAKSAAEGSSATPSELPWYESCATVLPYAVPIDWEFPGNGTLDLVPAGLQDSAYSLRVTSFNWQEFYEVLGGGVFLEALKRRLREDYDYVLIDSRTGLSDTAGICTVQMPDHLVICFTLNQQSIKGAAAVAVSAERQRRKPNGEPGLQIWPVPMRIELAESHRLESARDLARTTFQRHLGRFTRRDRAAYWGPIEVLYRPLFAYEELLAVFAERRLQTGGLLGSFEALTRQITNGQVTALAEIPEEQRRAGFAKFNRHAPPASTMPAPVRSQVYLSYSRRDRNLANTVAERLSDAGIQVWWDVELLAGDDWDVVSREAMRTSAALLVLMSDQIGDGQLEEIDRAKHAELRVIPVLAPGVSPDMMPESTRRLHALSLGIATDADLSKLVTAVQRVLHVIAPEVESPHDPDDPQKGRWGGQAASNGRVLSATVSERSAEWYSVTLSVTSSAGPPITGHVEFHLHPTFVNETVVVEVDGGKAELTLECWGAFTVGAVVDGGQTRLELDLSQDPSLPKPFRER